MLRVFLYDLCTLLYMEILYHIGCSGLTPVNPLIAIPVWILFAGLASLITGLFHKKGNRIVFFTILSLTWLLFASQLVYMKIFKQPLLMAAVTNGGKDALTHYWREALTGILHASGWLLLLALPIAAAVLLSKKHRADNKRLLPLERHTKKERLINAAITAGGLCSFFLVCVIGFSAKTEYYENYSEFYNPHGVISVYGVMPSVVRELRPQTLSAAVAMLQISVMPPFPVTVPPPLPRPPHPRKSPVRLFRKVLPHPELPPLIILPEIFPTSLTHWTPHRTYFPSISNI